MPKPNIAFCLFLIIVDIVCKLYPEMNATKKVKLIESGRLFREEWKKLFGAIERNRKALCTLCGDSVVCRTSSVMGMMNENATSNSENEILIVWNSLPISFKSMKSLGIALLTLFGSSYSREQLFSTMNFIKSERRNRLTDVMSSACATLKFTKYEPSINKLSATLQQQKSH